MTITKAAQDALETYTLTTRGALRTALQDKAGEVRQFRRVGCADWYDGNPDHEDGRGPYEARTLYASQPAPVVPDDVARDAGWFRLIRDGGGWPAVFASHDAPEPLRGDDLDASMIAASQQKGGEHG